MCIGLNYLVTISAAPGIFRPSAGSDIKLGLIPVPATHKKVKIVLGLGMAQICRSGQYWRMAGPMLARRATAILSRTPTTTTTYSCNPGTASHFRTFSSPSQFLRTPSRLQSSPTLLLSPSTTVGCMSSSSLGVIKNLVTRSTPRIQSISPAFIVSRRNYVSAFAKGLMTGQFPL